MKKNLGTPHYGNWVSNKLIGRMCILFFVCALAAAALFVFGAQWGAAGIVPGVLLSLLAVFFLTAGVYFLRARHLFSGKGGDIQGKVLGLVMDHIVWDGEGQVLDIGCGSGALAITIAKAYPDAEITGADYWDGSWGYGQQQCEDNACIEGVAERTHFEQASASKLPFADGTFGLVVSNLVFHEVKDSRDKRALIREALRVLKKGGSFVFQDLLQLTPYFGTTDELLAFIRECGVAEVHYEDTSKSSFIPRTLKLPFMAGTLAMVYGVK